MPIMGLIHNIGMRRVASQTSLSNNPALLGTEISLIPMDPLETGKALTKTETLIPCANSSSKPTSACPDNQRQPHGPSKQAHVTQSGSNLKTLEQIYPAIKGSLYPYYFLPLLVPWAHRMHPSVGYYRQPSHSQSLHI